MRPYYSLALIVIAGSFLAGLEGPAHGQVPSNPATVPPAGGFDPRYQFWSPATAVWDLQQQLNLAKPATVYGRHPAARDLQDAEPNVEGEDAPLAMPALPAMPDALADGFLFGPPKSSLDIPFEEFETFEEFNEWLRQKIAAPGDGAMNQGLPAGNAGNPPGAAATRNQAGRRPPGTDYRPPIGYIGVGSSARTQLGSINLGPNVAAESARLVTELNNYLRSSRYTQRSSPWQATESARGTLPPPTSDLGRRSPNTTVPPGGYRPAPARSGFAPQIQPRQYWQNLGGYEPPALRLEDWRP